MEWKDAAMRIEAARVPWLLQESCVPAKYDCWMVAYAESATATTTPAPIINTSSSVQKERIPKDESSIPNPQQFSNRSKRSEGSRSESPALAGGRVN